MELLREALRIAPGWVAVQGDGSVLLLSLGAALLASLLLGAALFWLRHRQRRQKALLAQTENLLEALNNGAIRQQARSFLVASPFFAQAIRNLRSSRTARRIKAIRDLARLDGAEVVPPLLGQLDEAGEVREEAIKALGSLREEAALDLLLSRWGEHPPGLVAEALVRHGPGIISKVGPMVTHADPMLRLWAVEVLKRLKAPQGVSFLVDALRDPQAVVRANAASALGEGASFLVDALRDPQAVVRANAASALGEVGTKDLRALAIALKHDPAPEVRAQAAQALVTLGGRQAATALQEAFLALGEQFLPWDATLHLWKTLKRCLHQVEALPEALGRLVGLPAEGFRMWLNIGVTAGDVETLTLTLHYAPERSQEVMAGLARAQVTHGEEAFLHQVVRGLNTGGTERLGALQALGGVSLSSSATARLSTEVSLLVNDPQEELRLHARTVLRSWGVPILEQPSPYIPGQERPVKVEWRPEGMPVPPERQPSPPPAAPAPGVLPSIAERPEPPVPGAGPESARPALEAGPTPGLLGKMQALVVDENPFFRRGLRHLLQLERMALVGEAGTVQDAERMLPNLAPGGIVFCSFSLPGGPAFLQRLAQECPDCIPIAIVEPRAGFMSLPAGEGKLLIPREVTPGMVLEAIRHGSRRAA